MTVRDPTTQINKAGEACRQMRCDEAISYLEEAARLAPSDADLYYRLGRCHSGGCGAVAGRSPETGISYLRHALSLLKPLPDHDVPRARVLDAMAHAHLSVQQRSSPERLLSAVACCHKAASLYLNAGEMEEWAREQFNLGNLCCDLAGEDLPQRWEDAIAHYERSLTVRTASADPAAHAATLQNLATAHRERRSGDRRLNIRKAILCSLAALRICRAAGLMAKRCAIHNNVGNAYLSLPVGKGMPTVHNIRRALRHFELALTIPNRSERPLDYASTQLNRGEAFVLLAAHGTREALASAEACFFEAEECFAACGQSERAAQVRERARRARCI